LHYEAVEQAITHYGNASGFSKDAFHIACISLKTRLQNVIRSHGIDPIEKALLKQHFANLSARQGRHFEK